MARMRGIYSGMRDILTGTMDKQNCPLFDGTECDVLNEKGSGKR